MQKKQAVGLSALVAAILLISVVGGLPGLLAGVVFAVGGIAVIFARRKQQ